MIMAATVNEHASAITSGFIPDPLTAEAVEAESAPPFWSVDVGEELDIVVVASVWVELGCKMKSKFPRLTWQEFSTSVLGDSKPSGNGV
jgi:hypothetical protein